MRAGELLRRLDSRLLPPLARGLARLSQGQVRPRVLTVAALVSVTAVLVTAVWAAERDPVVDHGGGDVIRVGVTEGQSIPGYVRSSRGRLDALLAASPAGPAPAETYALVTFTAYLAPDRLAPVLHGVSVSEVFGRVPLPGAQTQIVRIPAFRIPADVVAGMTQVADRKDAEARDYRARRAGLGDDEEDRELRELYDSGARIAAAEATAYRSHCSCLYAAVVRATPTLLDELARRPEVRAVDPVPELRRLERAVFLPPLPEQSDVVRPPDDDALPEPPPVAPSPAPASAEPVSPSPAAGTSTPMGLASSVPASPMPSAAPARSAPSATPAPSGMS